MKKVIGLFIVAISLFFGFDVVLAGFNGGKQPVGKGTVSSSNWKCVSPMANSLIIGVRFSMVYYNGTTFEKIDNGGKSDYIDIWLTNTSANYHYGINKTNNINISNYTNSYNYINYNKNQFFSQSGYPTSINSIKNKQSSGDYSIYVDNGLFYNNVGFPNVYSAPDIFENSEKNKEYLQSHLDSWFGISYDKIKKAYTDGKHITSEKCSELYTANSNSTECKGYRILMEPILQFVINNDNSKWFTLTLSEAAKIFESCGSIDNTRGMGEWLDIYAGMLYTKYMDIGISSGEAYKDTNLSGLINSKVGIGLNIIDPIFDDIKLDCKTVSENICAKGILNSNLRKVCNDIKDEITKTEFLKKYSSVINNTLYTDDTTKEKWTYYDYAVTHGCLDDHKVVVEDEPHDTKFDCTPKYNIGTCINKDDVSYQDLDSIASWENCVYNDKGSYNKDMDFHKSSKGTGNLSYYDSSMGSDKYCEVYCIESLETNFDSNVYNVYAGLHFTWMNHSVSGSRTCKTKSIEWDKFRKELANDNIAIEKAFNTYLVARDQQASVVATPTICCTGGGCGKDGTSCCPTSGTRYTWKSASYGSGLTRVSETGGSTSCGGAPDFGTSTKYKEYFNIRNDAIGDYNSMRSCYTWNQDNVYNLIPKLSISYSDNYYEYNGELNNNVVQDNMNINNDCKGTGVDVLTTCSDEKSSCTIENKNINQCSYNNQKRSKIYNFTFKESGIFQYVIKRNNESVDTNELSKYANDFTNNYIDIGYSNFPVAYKTPDGTYGVPVGKGELSLYYSKLGHQKSDSTAIDVILSSKGINYNSDYTKWQCIFNVKSKLIPDGNGPVKINLLYRPIDLNNPFPDINGEGRGVGSNWCGMDGCAENNELVKKVITNNRNATSDDVYYVEPMYTFVLNSKTIREIRRYNHKNSYTNYTGSLDGKNYDYKCIESTGKNCISDYLSYLIDITGAKEYPGTCVNDLFRTYNDSTSFENCRYGGIE